MSRRLVVRVGAGRVRLADAPAVATTDPSTGSAQTTGDAERSYQTENELRLAVSELVGPENGLRFRVLVEIEPPVLQARTLTGLPPVGRRALEELVAHSTGRFFRQNGIPLVSAAAWIRGDDPTERVARAVAVELPVAEAIVTGVGQSGSTLVDVIPLGDAAPALSLLPPRERERRKVRWRGRMLVALVAVAALWVVSIGGAWWWLRAGNQVLATQLEELQAPLAALRHARASMDSAAVMLAALEKTQRQRAAMAWRLATLVAALPDSTVLTELHVSADGDARLRGQARRAPRIASELSAASGIDRVRLSVQGSGDSVQGLSWDRFTVNLVVLQP